MADSASEMDIESEASSVDGAIDRINRENFLHKRLDSLQQANQVLKLEMETMRIRYKSLQEENKQLRQNSVEILAKAEQEEEYISNTLMKKINELKKEKESLAVNYEQEEEYLTNDLTRRLSQLQQEKVALEATLGKEQEKQINKLQRRIQKLEQDAKSKQQCLDTLRKEKIELENALEQEQEALVNRLWKKMERLENEKKALKKRLDQTLGTSNDKEPNLEEMCGLPGGSPCAPVGLTPVLRSHRNSRNPSMHSQSSVSNEHALSISPQPDRKFDTPEQTAKHIEELRATVQALRDRLKWTQHDYTQGVRDMRREERTLEKQTQNIRKQLEEQHKRSRDITRNYSESESSVDLELDDRDMSRSRYVQGRVSPIPRPPSANSSLLQTQNRVCSECGQSITACRTNVMPAQSTSLVATAGSNSPKSSLSGSSSFAKPSAPMGSSTSLSSKY